MSDALTTIPLQVPTSSVKNAGALQVNLSAQPMVIEYVIPSHPLPVNREWVTTALQTNAVLIVAPGVGVRTALTKLAVLLSANASVNVDVRIGFAATTLSPESFAGVDDIAVNHQLTPGGGIILGNGSAIICQGAANLPLRITNTVPTGGRLIVLATFFQPQIA
jgi:hypothetical protein